MSDWLGLNFAGLFVAVCCSVMAACLNLITQFRNGSFRAVIVLVGALVGTPAFAVPFEDTIVTGAITGTPKSGVFEYGTTFSAISDVQVTFSGNQLGFNEGVRLVLGTQVFNLGTDATTSQSPPFTRNIALNNETLEDLADGTIDALVSVYLRNGATFSPMAISTRLKLAFEGTEGPPITFPKATIADFTGPLNGPQFAQITLSEDATDFVVGDLTLTNATATLSGSGASYTAVLTPLADGPIALSIAAATFTDAAGNLNTASNEVTSTFDGTAPTVTVTSSTDSFAGTAPFTVTVVFTEPVIGFEVGDLSVVNATASGFSGDGTAFTATIAPTGTGDVTIMVPEGIAEDAAGNLNTASALVTVNGMTTAVTQERIASFMMSRATALLGNQPDLSRLLGVQDNSFDASVTKGLGTFDFATRTDGPIWARITGSVAQSDTSESTYMLGVLGSHMTVNENLLIGAMVQLDYAEEVTGASMVSGTGWLAGPYVVARSATQPLVFESSLLYGRTSNDISPFGTYSDTFETERFLATAKLTGNIQGNDIIWYPNLGFSYVHDAQAAYTDSLNNVIGKQTIEMTEATIGLDFVRTFSDEYTLLGGITGIYSQSGGTGGQAASLAPYTEGMRARIDLGMNFASDDGIPSGLSVFYDGIGVSGYDAFGVDVSVAIEF